MVVDVKPARHHWLPRYQIHWSYSRFSAPSGAEASGEMLSCSIKSRPLPALASHFVVVVQKVDEVLRVPIVQTQARIIQSHVEVGAKVPCPQVIWKTMRCLRLLLCGGGGSGVELQGTPLVWTPLRSSTWPSFKPDMVRQAVTQTVTTDRHIAPLAGGLARLGRVVWQTWGVFGRG